jgi:hypothetical protein
MKNEKKFKQKIAEVAAKIAEESREVETDEASPNQQTPVDVTKFTEKLDTYNQALTPFYNLINSAQELELAVLYIVEKLPNINPGNAVTGLRRAIDSLAKEKANASEKDPISTDALPALQEAFNRINRK